MDYCTRRSGQRSYPIANGRVITVIVRDSVVPEDPYLVLARAIAFSIKTGDAYKANATPRRIKDALIKTNITI